MLYLIDRRTGFFYLGPKREVYIYYNVKNIPVEFRQKQYITTEFFSETEELEFLTNLYNNGIYYININGYKQSITAEEIAYFKPNHISYYVSRYIIGKKKEDYNKIWNEKMYLLTRIKENGLLSFATVKKDNENMVVGFADRATADNFREEKKLTNYELLQFHLTKGTTYLLIGCNHKITLRKDD